jgi:hypothetical protein
MKTLQKLAGMFAMLSLGALSSPAAGHTYNLPNLASGNWNTADQRQSGNYQIGFNAQRPLSQAAYFEFNLDPAKGKHITSANMLIIGSTDYHISVSRHDPAAPLDLFKVGIRPMDIGANSVSQIVTGNNISGLYKNQVRILASADNGFAWLSDGLHTGVRIDAFHFEATGAARPRLQDAVNAGGLFVMIAADRFDIGNDGANYIWGSTSFNSGTQLQIITSD